MGQQLVIVDAFTSEPFSGNPAAVCMIDHPVDDQWMQHVAREMNLSETAFVERHDTGFGLRWFTPTVEVDLCGHATLASAHLLWEQRVVPTSSAVRFMTRSGVLTASRQGDLIELDFPATPAAAAGAPKGLIDALGVSPTWVGATRFDYLVEVESADIVRKLQPDITRLGRMPVRGVIVTAPADDATCDFVSRFFAPASGVPEDPVTGSAHCALAPHWVAKLGRRELTGRQLSARGGTVTVRHEGERVVLGGRAVTVLKGELLA